jgi:hypothetical protein
MENYKVKLDFGWKESEIMVRAESQEDANRFIESELESGNLLHLNPTGKTKVIK